MESRRQKGAAEGDGEEAWLTAMARGRVEVWRELRERAKGLVRLRESSVMVTGVGGTRVHDGGTVGVEVHTRHESRSGYLALYVCGQWSRTSRNWVLGLGG